ncbi:hypothetical protein Kpho01_57070 [Kitasatospora phosalacinea]|uniref:Uncharacterized protein n=1 Tax=Kitasatospora phosalacinea TaxID=2065 RepID=A0A9W6PMD4_9ACTN|nr:hypothetical protein Kpho01_57070 [Kitasatospora phosalacinea]
MSPGPPTIKLPVLQLPRTPIVERTRNRYTDVHRPLEQKWTISAIARRSGLDRKTVRRFKITHLDELLASAREFGASKQGLIGPFKPYLNSRFTAGCTSAQQLFREITERAYRGSVLAVRRHVASPREGTAEPARAYDLARCFHDLTTNRLGTLLPDWIDQADQDASAPMRSFAGFLRQGLAAITAGLTLDWSSGKVEGNVNRVKTLKEPCADGPRSDSCRSGSSSDLESTRLSPNCQSWPLICRESPSRNSWRVAAARSNRSNHEAVVDLQIRPEPASANRWPPPSLAKTRAGSSPSIWTVPYSRKWSATSEAGWMK